MAGNDRIEVDVTVSFPDRQPGEPDITAEQLRTLRALGTVSDPAAELLLGRVQADALIRDLRRRKGELSQAAVQQQARSVEMCDSARGKGLLQGFFIGTVLSWIFRRR